MKLPLPKAVATLEDLDMFFSAPMKTECNAHPQEARRIGQIQCGDPATDTKVQSATIDLSEADWLQA